MTPIAITGLGVASPLGVGHETVWQRLLDLQPALCEAPPSPAGLETRPATAFAEEFVAEDYAPPRKVRKCSNLARLAVVAGLQCAEHAALPDDAELREATGVVLGTCFGSSDYYLKFHEGIRRKGVRAANSVLFTEGVFNSATGHLCQLLKLRGPSLAVVGGEECGLSAILTAADRVRLGAARAVLAGGCEEFCDRVQGSLLAEQRVGATLGGLASETPGPMAEGSAALCVEPLAAAEARGATIQARLLAGARARPGSAGADDPAPLTQAAKAALAAAERTPDQVDLIVGGATGGPGTVRELAALRALFGDASPVYCAPGALLGEGFGFTSALQALVGVQALATQTTPPTFPGPAPLTDVGSLRLLTAPEPQALNTVLVLGASQPGGAVALVFSR